MVVGICVGKTSLTEVTFISDKMPKVGEYVTIEYDGKKVLGMIENLIRGNDALNVDINDFKAIQKISSIGVEDMAYQSEAALEQQFIEQLNKQEYSTVSIQCSSVYFIKVNVQEEGLIFA